MCDGYDLYIHTREKNKGSLLGCLGCILLLLFHIQIGAVLPTLLYIIIHVYYAYTTIKHNHLSLSMIIIIIYSVQRTHKTQFYTGGGGGVLYRVIQFSCRYTKLGYHILPPSTSILNKKGYKIYFCLSYLKLFCVLPSFAYLFYSHRRGTAAAG